MYICQCRCHKIPQCNGIFVLLFFKEDREKANGKLNKSLRDMLDDAQADPGYQEVLANLTEHFAGTEDDLKKRAFIRWSPLYNGMDGLGRGRGGRGGRHN